MQCLPEKEAHDDPDLAALYSRQAYFDDRHQQALGELSSLPRCDTPGCRVHSTPYIAVINNFNFPFTMDSIPELSSDHNPVFLNFPLLRLYIKTTLEQLPPSRRASRLLAQFGLDFSETAEIASSPRPLSPSMYTNKETPSRKQANQH
ncbi:hypothetical protein TNCV_1623131 [Trichonephila clavipes]|nr:hypothetical protein TNCV_1623131 [Trichonephila clavipes]